MKENAIKDKIKGSELKAINEKIISGDDDGVYIFFSCTNYNVTRYPITEYCIKCPWYYKVDIRMPGVLGCYVRDYIDEIKAQSKK
jgi:hypothetical protein